MKKYLAEAVGTMVLVLMGRGAAVSLGCTSNIPALSATVLGTALAFGLAVVAMAYTIGGISGCHINPAITLGVWMSGRMSGKDAGMYM
ncbi:MAG: aquaporin, partial [Bacteroidaceae bacterium]|nr:aquaporin [Bacteroidaceae bacterium]